MKADQTVSSARAERAAEAMRGLISEGEIHLIVRGRDDARAVWFITPVQATFDNVRERSDVVDVAAPAAAALGVPLEHVIFADCVVWPYRRNGEQSLLVPEPDFAVALSQALFGRPDALIPQPL